ncbi:MAG: complement resistance protein TraT, partial [Patescibacteria group bacterium]
IGGIIGAAVGFVADVATRVKTEIIVIEFQIAERLAGYDDILGQQVEETEVTTDIKALGGLGTKTDMPTTRSSTRKITSKKDGVNIYNAGVAARAAQVNLNVDEAVQKLIQSAGQQIAGIF